MLEEDREAIRQMKADFETLAELTENDFKDHVNFGLRMNHYTTVYTAATRNSSKASEYPGYDASELLYMDYQEMLTRYLLRYRDVSSGATSDSEVFEKVLKVWGHYKVLMRWNMRAFAYLSRYYIVNHSKPSLHTVALTIFLEQIFKKNAGVVSRVTQDLLLRERAGECVDRQQIISAIDLLSSMNVDDTQSIYAEQFLEPYLAKTKTNFESFLAQIESTRTASEFLADIHSALSDERVRCTTYFSAEDEKAIMARVESVVLESEITQRKLLTSDEGFCNALRQRDEAELKCYYDLFSRRSSGLRQLGMLIRKEIEAEGVQISADFSADESSMDVVKYTEAMMRLQDVFPQLLSRCFQLDFNLSKAVREGLESAYKSSVKVANRVTGETRQIVFCDWLASYVDLMLQVDRDSATDDIERAVSTLAFVVDRDRFLANSRERLADRILFPLNTFNEAREILFIQRVRQRCAVSSTAHLEGMLFDLDTSRNFNAMDKLREIGRAPPYAVSLLVKKKGIWPTRVGEDSEVRIPPILSETLHNLGEVYLKGTSGRVLSWSVEYSSAEVLGRFTKGVHTLCVTGLAALILLAFNEVDVLTPAAIMERFGVTFDVVRRVLPSLTRGKAVLRRSSGPTLQETDELVVNADFTARARKVRFPPNALRVSVLGSDEIDRQVEEDRKPAIDACIVRIMKTHRTMQHTDLVDECHKELEGRFSPDMKLIKQRIEELIRKEYIERDAKHPATYRYLA